MKRLSLTVSAALVAALALAGPVGAKDFGTIFANDAVYRTFGNPANVPDGTGTDPFAKILNSTNPAQVGVAAFAPGSAGNHHGGRWAVHEATWTATGDPSTLITSWTQLEDLVAAGQVDLVRVEADDFRCPVLGNPASIG